MAMARSLVGRAGVGMAAAPLPSPRSFGLLTILPRSSSSCTQPAFSATPLRTPGAQNWFPRSLLASSQLGVFAARSSSASVEQQTSEAEGVPAAVTEEGPVTEIDLGALDIRVGKILKAWKHPEADSLYVEEVEVGEESGPRTICSGLVKYVPEEELQGRSVLVLANLKPRNMRGVKSNGMLMAASDAAHEHVELLTPPEAAVPGERAWFGSVEDQSTQGAAATPNQLQKKKIWETVQPLLTTTEDCVATFQDKPLRVSSGVVRCKTLRNANVS